MSLSNNRIYLYVFAIAGIITMIAYAALPPFPPVFPAPITSKSSSSSGSNYNSVYVVRTGDTMTGNLVVPTLTANDVSNSNAIFSKSIYVNTITANTYVNVPTVVASNSIIGASATANNLMSYANVAGTYEIGGYIDVTSFTLGTLSYVVTYTDPSGSPTTQTIPLSSLNGVVASTVGSLTDASALVTPIRASAGTIGVNVIATSFTGTYSAYGYVVKVV